MQQREAEPLNHEHGAPLRLRVENELGFKMVKWVRVIEFAESVKSIHKGEGGVPSRPADTCRRSLPSWR